MVLMVLLFMRMAVAVAMRVVLFLIVTVVMAATLSVVLVSVLMTVVVVSVVLLFMRVAVAVAMRVVLFLIMTVVMAATISIVLVSVLSLRRLLLVSVLMGCLAISCLFTCECRLQRRLNLLLRGFSCGLEYFEHQLGSRLRAEKRHDDLHRRAPRLFALELVHNHSRLFSRRRRPSQVFILLLVRQLGFQPIAHTVDAGRLLLLRSARRVLLLDEVHRGGAPTDELMVTRG